jgi:hypothetical protein
VTEPVPQTEAPPAGEELHLPGPSIVPLLNAVGISVAIIGLTTGRVLIVGGLLLFLITTAIWIRDAIRDIDELPAEHSH